MKKLYKVTAHCCAKQTVYYVVASDPAKAEEKVVDFHRGMNYFNVDYCDFETIAVEDTYGKPTILLI